MYTGNIVGSCMINMTLILATTLILSDLTVNIDAFTNKAVFNPIANLFLRYFLSGYRICWREGAVLVALYVVSLFSTLRGYGI